MAVQLVWYKRDLRVRDHRPLAEAAAAGPVLPLYIVEDGYWRRPGTAQRHWAFVRSARRAVHAYRRRDDVRDEARRVQERRGSPSGRGRNA